MLDTVELDRIARTVVGSRPRHGEDSSTTTRPLVPTLDWPADLFAACIADTGDESE